MLMLSRFAVLAGCVGRRGPIYASGSSPSGAVASMVEWKNRAGSCVGDATASGLAQATINFVALPFRGNPIYLLHSSHWATLTVPEEENSSVIANRALSVTPSYLTRSYP